MSIFIDTSAFIALINLSDEFHSIASDLFTKATEDDEKFFTSNYVILETIFLLQREIGLSAVNDFKKSMLPIINIIWVDEKIHNDCLNNLIAAEKRKISLTDYSSFYILDNYKIDMVFTFDKHFKEKDYKFLE
ncbi:MAG: PIN domain-containing protein [Actinobacteria bacterium]|nr:PIN domain-containing protein [Actinomycetota bacterium]